MARQYSGKAVVRPRTAPERGSPPRSVDSRLAAGRSSHGKRRPRLIINSCITTLGALSGMTLGRMLLRGSYRRLFIDVIREGVAAAEAAGLRIPAYGGKLDYHSFVKGAGALADLRRHAVLCVMGLKYRRLKSSSLQSLERGRKTEVDFFNGYIVRAAAARGVAAPVNEALTRMVHELEAGARRIGPHNVGRKGRLVDITAAATVSP
jgi:2-dehydropantoate 2-reductase